MTELAAALEDALDELRDVGDLVRWGADRLRARVREQLARTCVMRIDAQGRECRCGGFGGLAAEGELRERDVRVDIVAGCGDLEDRASCVGLRGHHRDSARDDRANVCRI